MSERITGLEHLSTGQNCFTWRIAPPVEVGPTASEKRLQERRDYQRVYEANRRAKEREAMRKASTRVNPENFSCASFTPKSTRAAR
jgi:hypothetical protein